MTPVLAHGSGADEAAFVLAPLVLLGAIAGFNRLKQRRAGGCAPAEASRPPSEPRP